MHEDVDCIVGNFRMHLLLEDELVLRYLDELVIGNDIDASGFDLEVACCLEHFHVRMTTNKLDQQTFMVGRQVLDNNERQVIVIRHVVEKLMDCFKAACGS